MDISLVIFVVVITSLITVLYKFLPHRDLGENKPFISFFPKFRTKVKLPSVVVNAASPENELEKILSSFGFSKKNNQSTFTKYSRGNMLGDFSVKLAKVNLLVTDLDSEYVDICIEAGWVVAFDTGDFWKFLCEVKSKVESITV